MKVKHILITALISFVISAGSIFGYDQFFAQKIIMFDLKGYIATLRDLYIAGKIDDKQLQSAIDRIEVVVNSQPKRKIIITSDVLLGENRVENITPKFERTNIQQSTTQK
jgi:hypothetical protein